MGLANVMYGDPEIIGESCGGAEVGILGSSAEGTAKGRCDISQKQRASPNQETFTLQENEKDPISVDNLAKWKWNCRIVELSNLTKTE
jgi:hypothetical protein